MIKINYVTYAAAATVLIASLFAARSFGGSGVDSPDYSAQDLCGESYSIVDEHRIDSGSDVKVKVSIGYNSDTKSFCGVVVREDNSPKASMSVSLTVPGHPSDTDKGDAADYAGPVFVYAKQQCTKWGGSVNDTQWTSPRQQCGAVTAD
ncbi:hypothetical protein [Streptomyces sp. NPDC051286]|uniref:hypothetical protein n=1 Tax=Streptomyces sp. NPDC051286 TaxID=3365647 RepID=UPI0037B8D82E